MARQDRSSGREPGTRSPDKEVVRLPVSEPELSDRLEEMPSPRRVARLQPSPQVDLIEDEVEEGVESGAVDLGVGWDEDEEARSYTPMGWLVLIGVALVILGGWAWAKLAVGEATVEEASQQIRDARDLEAQEHRDALALLTKVEALVADYVEASDLETKAKFVRHRERVFPLMQDYYDRHEIKSAQFVGITDFHPVGVGNYPFFFLAVRLKGESEPKILFVEELSDGELQFDWESEVGYLPMEVSEYLEKKPSEPMDFRVYVRLDTFLGYEFADGSRYQPLMLTFRDTDEFLFGYIDKNNPDEAGLVSYLWRHVRVPQPFILRLRFLPGSKSRRSVLVEKVVSPRWVYLTPSEEEKAP